MKLTPLEAEQAKQAGWLLCEVYDLGQKKVFLDILPAEFGKSSAAQAQQRVVESAKRGDPLAVKALTLVAQSKIYRRK